MDKRDSVLAAVLKVLERFWGPHCQYHPDVDAGGGMFWRGVTLRPDAFDALGLPLAVRSGSIARLHISAGPGGEEEAANTGGLCLRVELEGLELVLAEVEDEDSSRAAAVERQQRLATLEADTRTRMQRLIGSVAAGSLLSQGVMSSLVGHLLDRVAIRMQNVHIRCLGGSSGGTDFVVGVICEVISLAASAEEQGVHQGQPPRKVKDALVQGLCVYWQRGGSEAQAPQESPTPGIQPPEGACKLLHPLEVRAKAVIERLSDGPEGGSAGLQAAGGDWVLREVSVSTSAVHLRAEPAAITDLASLLQNGFPQDCRPALQPPRSCGIIRPSVSFKRGAAAWLQYAQACVTSRIRRQRMALHPEAVAQRVCDLKRYRLLYGILLDASLERSLGREVKEAGGAAGESDSARERTRTRAGAQSFEEELADLECGLPLQAVMALRDACEACRGALPAPAAPTLRTPAAVSPGQPISDGYGATGGTSGKGEEQSACSAGSEQPCRLDKSLGYFWWLPRVLTPLQPLASALTRPGGEDPAGSEAAGSSRGGRDADTFAYWAQVLGVRGQGFVGRCGGGCSRCVTVRVEVGEGTLDLGQGEKKTRAAAPSPGAARESLTVARVEVKGIRFLALTFVGDSSVGAGAGEVARGVKAGGFGGEGGWVHMPRLHGKTAPCFEGKAWVFSTRLRLLKKSPSPLTLVCIPCSHIPRSLESTRCVRDLSRGLSDTPCDGCMEEGVMFLGS